MTRETSQALLTPCGRTKLVFFLLWYYILPSLPQKAERNVKQLTEKVLVTVLQD